MSVNNDLGGAAVVAYLGKWRSKLFRHPTLSFIKDRHWSEETSALDQLARSQTSNSRPTEVARVNLKIQRQLDQSVPVLNRCHGHFCLESRTLIPARSFCYVPPRLQHNAVVARKIHFSKLYQFVRPPIRHSSTCRCIRAISVRKFCSSRLSSASLAFSNVSIFAR